eukprot:218701-Prymnesium_polylepis.1
MARSEWERSVRPTAGAGSSRKVEVVGGRGAAGRETEREAGVAAREAAVAAKEAAVAAREEEAARAAEEA